MKVVFLTVSYKFVYSLFIFKPVRAFPLGKRFRFLLPAAQICSFLTVFLIAFVPFLLYNCII